MSIERNPPIREVIDCGVVPIFVEFLRRADHAQLQVIYLTFFPKSKKKKNVEFFPFSFYKSLKQLGH